MGKEEQSTRAGAGTQPLCAAVLLLSPAQKPQNKQQPNKQTRRRRRRRRRRSTHTHTQRRKGKERKGRERKGREDDGKQQTTAAPPTSPPHPHTRPQYTTQLQLCVASSYLAPCVLLWLVTMTSSCMQCQASEGKAKRWASSCSDAQACACGGTTQGRGHCGTRAEGRCPLYRAASKTHTLQVHARASVLDSPPPHRAKHHTACSCTRASSTRSSYGHPASSTSTSSSSSGMVGVRLHRDNGQHHTSQYSEGGAGPRHHSMAAHHRVLQHGNGWVNWRRWARPAVALSRCLAASLPCCRRVLLLHTAAVFEGACGKAWQRHHPTAASRTQQERARERESEADPKTKKSLPACVVRVCVCFLCCALLF